jgi:tetratricopeptide (TPR) repeat protein
VNVLLADCWLRLGENKKVIAMLDPTYAAKRDDDALAYLLGTALIRDEQVSRGQLVIDKILHNGDSAEARLLMGTTKLSVRDYSGALKDLSRAAELNPTLPSVHSYYGRALLATGDVAGAMREFRSELQQDPNDFDSNLNLGALLRQDQNLDQAGPYVERALRVRPRDPRAEFQMSSIEVARGHLEEARRRLENTIEEAPAFVEAHVTLATVYYRLKRKVDGDRERSVVEKLNAEIQAHQPAVQEGSGPAEKPQR